MKKIFVIIVFMVAGICVKAQVDTLFLGDRDPVYYYWDTNWWDHYALNYPDKDKEWYDEGMFAHNCQPEFARYCYIDTSLRVIGIAAALVLGVTKTTHCNIPDTFFFNKMVPEYFRLYEVDSNGDEMHLMAEGEWTYKTPQRHIMQASRHTDGWTHDNFDPIYEVYFNEPVTVYDSFYVAVTGCNNYWPPDFYEHYSPPQDSWATAYPVDIHYQIADTMMFPKPNHYKRKLHYFDEDNYDYRYGVTDTNWHTFNKVSHNNSDSNPASWRRFMCIFPIIDTSRVIACGESQGLTLAYLEGSVATLTWEGGYNADHWELSLCPDNCNADEGTVTQWNTRFATLQGLDTARWYTAWVRSVCDSVRSSDWSDSIRFYVPGNGGEQPENIGTIADRHTYLMPNPASETVTIASSFRIGEVEVYDLNGKRLMRKTINGMQGTINLSDTPAGTYIVRIGTNKGTTYKKLVVK